MVNALSAPAAPVVAAVSPEPGLQAQLSRLSDQLASCVNCSSSKTPEGKIAIQAISIKIDALRARIAEIAENRARSVAHARRDGPGIVTAPAAGAGSAAKPASQGDALGGTINLFA